MDALMVVQQGRREGHVMKDRDERFLELELIVFVVAGASLPLAFVDIKKSAAAASA